MKHAGGVICHSIEYGEGVICHTDGIGETLEKDPKDSSVVKIE